ncbi:hypothetical protein HWV62_7622 [Athelia sp. TMB]|nr:hypothetical protein HWV62_7622 [Athelia sp. TMB]
MTKFIRIYSPRNDQIGEWPASNHVRNELHLTIIPLFRLVIKAPSVVDGVQVTTRFGLMERCERRIVWEGRNRWVDHTCRSFPMRIQDHCEQENRHFCTEFTSARYATELGIGFSAMALVALLIGVSTHSKRRRIWRAVAGLVALHAVFQLITFALITDIYLQGRYEPFNEAGLSAGYYMNLISWVTGFFTAIGVIITGLAADKGYTLPKQFIPAMLTRNLHTGRPWAAGNRAYRPISA